MKRDPSGSLPGYADRAAKLAGSYWPTRHSYTTLEKFNMLFTTMSVTPTGNGHLSISTGLGSPPLDVVEVAPWVFRQVRPQDFGLDVGTIVFQTNASGSVTSVLLGNLPIQAWQRIAWYEVPGLNLLLLVLSLLTFLAALIVWPIRYLLSPAGQRRLHAVASAARLGFMRVARRADSERRAPAAQPLPVASVGSPMEGKQRGTSLAEGAAGPSVETAQDHALIAPLQASADPSPEAAGSGTQVPAAPTDSDPLGVRRMPRDQFGRAAHVLAGVACGDFVLFAIGLAVVFTTQAGLAYGATPLAFAVLALGVVGAVLTALVVVCAFLIWRDHLWNLAGRIFYTLVTLAAVAFVWELVLWNLLGVHV